MKVRPVKLIANIPVSDSVSNVKILTRLICSFFSIYQTPESNKNFKLLLYTIKNDYSSSLLQEGVFNTIGKDFTIFIKESNKDGLNNIFILKISWFLLNMNDNYEIYNLLLINSIKLPNC